MSVSIVKVEKANFQQIYSSIEKIFALNNVQIKKKIFIKPNLCSPVKANTGIVTDPLVVKALIHVLRKNGVEEIIIGEDVAPGGNTKNCFEATGFNALAKEENVELIDLNDAEREIIKWKFGELSIPSILLDSQIYYINVPKMKTHLNTTVTISMKNQKGIVLGNDKKKFHTTFGLHESISELAKVIRPDFILVDGILGLEGDGPGKMGKCLAMNLLIGGDNQVEIDATCSRIMGIEPLEVKHIRMASEIGLGTLHPIILGEKIENVQHNFIRANSNYINKLNIYIQCSDDGCSACNKAVVNMRNLIIKNPKYWLPFLRYGIIGRVDYIIGAKCKVPETIGKKICVGNCTKDTAKKYNISWVKGCPPEPIELLKVLSGEK